MKKALIYCRVSTAGQDEKGTSLESQIAACTKHAQHLKMTPLATFKEVYSGAYLHERPMLTEIRDIIRRGEADALICYAVDRLSRNFAHLALVVDECERFNTELIFVSEDLDYSPEGKLLQSVRGYVAEIEREKIRERSLRGKRTKAAAGNLSFRHKVYGYKWNEEAGRRVVIHEEAETVKRLYCGMLAGRTMRGLATELDLLGVPTPEAGTYWNQSTVRRILQNPAYAGKTYAFRYKRVVKMSNGKRVAYNVERPRDEWVLQNDSITPAIIEPDAFERVQNIIEYNRKQKRREPQAEFLLRNRITCGICGRQMTTNTDGRTRKDGTKWRSYVCDSRRSPLTKCGNKVLNAQKAESQLWEIVSDVIEHPEIALKQLEKSKSSHTRQRERLAKDVSGADASIRRIESEIKNLVSRGATLPDDVWKMVEEQIRAKQTELDKIKAIRSDLESSLSVLNSQTIDRKNFVAQCEALRASRDKVSFEDKCRILTALNVRLTWDGEKLKIDVSPKIVLDNRNDDQRKRRSGRPARYSFVFKKHDSAALRRLSPFRT